MNAACVNQYFCDSNSEDLEDNLSDGPIYKEILDSKSADEVLVRCTKFMLQLTYRLQQWLIIWNELNFYGNFQALYASWEPRLPRHCFRFPWKQYVKVGTVLRHFGYTIVALHGCLQTEIQVMQLHFFIDSYYFLLICSYQFFSIIVLPLESCRLQKQFVHYSRTPASG